MIQQKLEKVDNNLFSISKYNFLFSISNLIPNSSYDITFNDLFLQFLSDSNGVIYMNKNKDYLPVGCIPYNDIRIQPGVHNNIKNMNIPIGNYSNDPHIDWPCKDIKMTLSLIMFDVKTQTFIPVDRNIIIQNGSLTLIENFRDFSSLHIGVL